MNVEITSVSGNFPALTARMLWLELEAAGIISSSPAPVLYIYVDTGGNTTLQCGDICDEDRYFKYPFRIDIFIAAVSRVLKATAYKLDISPETNIKKLRFIFNDDLKQFAIGDKIVSLSEREYRLLRYLYDRRGSAVGRDELVGAVWDNEAGNGTNVVEVYINYLRRKLESVTGEQLIFTRRGQGYEFRDII